MRFAFAIVSLFPGGGLQRDCVDIARRIRDFGHEVVIFTSRRSDDDFGSDLQVRILYADGRTNHRRQITFSQEFGRQYACKFDLRVGFDKLAALDVLYCSDRSMRARVTRNPLLKLLPRYRNYVDLERKCFERNQKTKVLLLSEPQLHEYWSSWTTEENRLIIIPPTLSPARRRPEYRTDGTRERLRAGLDLSPADWTWITVCVQPKTKGLDRTVRALRQFTEARLLIVGLDKSDTRSKEVRDLAELLGVAKRVNWLGHREDIPELMAASDVLVHPARYDTTGTVILEAVANGLAAVTTTTCGYARHVSNANAGIVIQEPYSQRELLHALETARDPVYAAHCSKLGMDYAKYTSLCDGKNRAAELILSSALKRNAAATEG
jgi:UDP-glucose:(heptosyl)LPS alpha-1,3-glucosyltransferase